MQGNVGLLISGKLALERKEQVVDEVAGAKLVENEGPLQ